MRADGRKMRQTPTKRLFERIYRIVRLIPHGMVATYGQIALHVGRCTPRLVGYALSALPFDGDIPWHRVINCKGMISLPRESQSAIAQRLLLEDEGILFDHQERVDLSRHGWAGPSPANENDGEPSENGPHKS